MTAPTFAQGSRSSLSYKLQSDFLTTAAANYTRARFNSHSLDYVKTTVESAEIRSDRLVEDFRHSQASVKGDVSVDLLYADHDWLLQTMMFNTYTGSLLPVGTTPQYYSAEDGALDIAQYRLYTGLCCTKASFDIKPNQIVKATFSMIGTAMAQSGSSSAGTLVAPSNNKPFDTFNAAIYTVGGTTGVTSSAKLANVSGLTLNIDNGIAATQQLGYQNPQAITFGRERVTGTLTMYYADATFINSFINETEVSLDISLTDPSGNVLNFGMPRVKYNGATVPVANEQSRFITLPFVALRELITTGTELLISK